MIICKEKKATEKQYLLAKRIEGKVQGVPAIDPQELTNEYELDLFIHKIPVWSGLDELQGKDETSTEPKKYGFSITERTTGFALTKVFKTRKDAIAEVNKIIEQFGIEKLKQMIVSQTKIV